MSDRRLSPRSASEWAAGLTTWVGLVMLVLLAVFWAVTGRVESALLVAFGSVVTAGLGGQALAALRSGERSDSEERS